MIRRACVFTIAVMSFFFHSKASGWLFTGTMALNDSPSTVYVAGQANGWPAGFSIAWKVSNEETGGPTGFNYY